LPAAERQRCNLVLQAALHAKYPAAERMLASEDAREGQRAFVEKRKARWQGK
jgi:crotonobetainyl-CoA hydratase